MITLDANQWHARLYRWTVWQTCYFNGDRKPGNRVQATNLCRYIRTLLVVLPLLLLSHLGLLALAVWVLVLEPIGLLGFNNYGYTLGAIDGAMVLAWLGVVAATSIGSAVTPVIMVAYGNHRSKRLSRPKRAKGPGMIRLIWRWVRDHHENFCSSITIQ